MEPLQIGKREKLDHVVSLQLVIDLLAITRLTIIQMSKLWNQILNFVTQFIINFIEIGVLFKLIWCLVKLRTLFWLELNERRVFFVYDFELHFATGDDAELHAFLKHTHSSLLKAFRSFLRVRHVFSCDLASSHLELYLFYI